MNRFTAVAALLFAATAATAQVQTPPTVYPHVLFRKSIFTDDFPGSQSVFSQNGLVYLASAQGTMPVCADDSASKNSSFPCIGSWLVSLSPVEAIAGDGTRTYVTAADGLHVFTGLSLTAFHSYGAPLNSLAVDQGPGGSITFSEGQGSLAANSRFVYFSKQNQSDIALSVDKQALAPQQTFVAPQLLTTTVFNRTTGAQVGTIPNPTIYSFITGTFNPTQVVLYATETMIAQGVPRDGIGVWLYDAVTLKLLSFVPAPATNVIRIINNGKWLVAGTESGFVTFYDITNLQNPVQIGSTNLGVDIGDTTGDIEPRSLAVDETTRTIFVTVSGSNGLGQPTPANFFVVGY